MQTHLYLSLLSFRRTARWALFVLIRPSFNLLSQSWNVAWITTVTHKALNSAITEQKKKFLKCFSFFRIQNRLVKDFCTFYEIFNEMTDVSVTLLKTKSKGLLGETEDFCMCFKNGFTKRYLMCGTSFSIHYFWASSTSCMSRFHSLFSWVVWKKSSSLCSFDIR